MSPKTWLLVLGAAAVLAVALLPAPVGSNSARETHGGWVRVQLSGSPREIGLQHGTVLAREIDDLRKVIELELTHDTDKPYSFFRAASKEMLWPRIDQEYRDELTGIAH